MATESAYNYGLDSRVLGRNNEAQASDQLRREQQMARVAEEEAMNSEAEQAQQSANEQGVTRNFFAQKAKASIRSNMRRSRKLRSIRARMFTNKVLRGAWFSLLTTYGLSFIYICVHKAMHRIMPRKFGVLGEEWMPPGMAAVKSKGDKTVGLLPLLENIVFWAIFFILLFAIIAFIAVVVIIVDVLSGVFGWFVDVFW